MAALPEFFTVDPYLPPWAMVPIDGHARRVRPSLDAMLGLLAHPHRREILRLFASAPSQPRTGADIVEAVVEHEMRTRERPLKANDVQALVRHVHLPKLREAGVIEPTQGNAFRYHPDERIERLLETIGDFE